MAVKYVGCEDVDWLQLVQDRVQCQALVNLVINQPLGIQVSNFFTIISLSRRLLYTILNYCLCHPYRVNLWTQNFL